MTAGRPPDYKPEFCKRVIELGKQGKTVTQMACEIGVAKSTVYLWEQQYPKFSDALKYARQLSQAWWENMGQNSLEKQTFQSAVYNKQMSCRFPEDYRDTTRSELTGKDGDPIKMETKVTQTDEEIIARFLKNRGSDAASD